MSRSEAQAQMKLTIKPLGCVLREKKVYTLSGSLTRAEVEEEIKEAARGKKQ